jgi:hypothetical protein
VIVKVGEPEELELDVDVEVEELELEEELTLDELELEELEMDTEKLELEEELMLEELDDTLVCRFLNVMPAQPVPAVTFTTPFVGVTSICDQPF